MLEWVILPVLVLIVLLSILTARPKRGADNRNDDDPEC
jgi:hypothetical protein